MNYVLNQLAHSKLLPPFVSAGMLAGNVPPVLELLNHLLTTTMDAHFITAGDSKASWIDKRLSHQNLVTAFMLALLVEQTFGPEHGGATTTVAREKKL
jgi:hypothetical protein